MTSKSTLDTKMCTKCLEVKGLDEFHRNRSKTDGRQSHCKDCLLSGQRASRKANPERARQTDRGYYWRNVEKKRETNRAYYWSNVARERERQREWNRNNPDLAHAKRLRRRASRTSSIHYPYSRDQIYARWCGRCCYCDAPAEHLDHVTPISRRGADAEWNLVPACASCNTSKGAKTLAEWAMTFMGRS